MNKVVQYVILLVIAGVIGIVTSQMVAAKPMAKGDIEQIVHDYIMNNPQVLVDSVNRYQQVQSQNTVAHSVQVMKDRAKDILEDPASPVVGNPNGDVTLVEFFDYQCGYCKRMVPTITQLVEEDKGLRVVMKEYPIFPGSDTASKIALAVYKVNKDKYFDFHRKAMELHEEPTEAALLRTAGEAGADPVAVKAAMGKPEIADALKKNHELAEALGIQGTPGFILGQELIPGALGLDDLKKKIADIRANKK